MSSIMDNLRRWRVVSCLLGCLYFLPSAMPQVWADPEEITFEKNLKYDIYYYLNESELNCVRSILILGVEKLGGQSFLVISTGDFNSENRKGYIAINSITTILPSHYFSPMGVPRFYYKEHHKVPEVQGNPLN